jgi:hypothetical protein
MPVGCFGQVGISCTDTGSCAGCFLVRGVQADGQGSQVTGRQDALLHSVFSASQLAAD